MFFAGALVFWFPLIFYVLYNANEELLAVAKLSRPVMKNDEKDLTFRVRLDF